MVDDSYYITPHETALAVVATSMKKARLRLETLVVNSLMGGILFSAGGMLFLYSKAENPSLDQANPGIVSFMGGFTYSIGLFYVVINGADLFNSNILFFSVGILRQAVTFYDLIISWSVSWLFNLAGNLFVAYVICYLSGVATSENMIRGSIEIVELKSSYSFIQTFIKGIAGNFCVCMAVYLQLMAKPLHVKYILMTLPIFTFVSMGFTHVVADMYLLPMGMINGHSLSVGKYIWKLLIPATLGNVIGGFAFSAIIPFYLHMVVVEMDRKQLELPEYEARDEQPELNVDSRVVRLQSHTVDEELNSEEEEEEKEEENENESDSLGSSSTDTGNEKYVSEPERYFPNNADNSSSTSLRRRKTISSRSNTKKFPIRSPAGVFPVKGMGEPLLRELSIVDPQAVEKVQTRLSKQNERNMELERRQKREEIPLNRPLSNPTFTESVNSFDLQTVNSDLDSSLSLNEPIHQIVASQRFQDNRSHERPPSSLVHRMKTLEDVERDQLKVYKEDGRYDVMDNKLGTKLKRALTHSAHRSTKTQAPTIASIVKNNQTEPVLPLTNQDISDYGAPTDTNKKDQQPQPGRQRPSLLYSLKKSFSKSLPAENSEEVHRRLSQAGITQRAARAADNIAGLENYQDITLPVSTSPFLSSRRSSVHTSSSAKRPPDPSSRPAPALTRNPESHLRNAMFYDNDNMEEQSIGD